MKYVLFPWPLHDAAFSNFSVNFLLKTILGGLNKNKISCYQWRITSFIKRPSRKDLFGSSVDRNVTKLTISICNNCYRRSLEWGLVHTMKIVDVKDVNESICSAAGFGLLLTMVLDSIAALTHCKQKYTLKLSTYIV